MTSFPDSFAPRTHALKLRGSAARGSPQTSRTQRTRRPLTTGAMAEAAEAPVDGQSGENGGWEELLARVLLYELAAEVAAEELAAARGEILSMSSDDDAAPAGRSEDEAAWEDLLDEITEEVAAETHRAAVSRRSRALSPKRGRGCAARRSSRAGSSASSPSAPVSTGRCTRSATRRRTTSSP